MLFESSVFVINEDYKYITVITNTYKYVYT